MRTWMVALTIVAIALESTSASANCKVTNQHGAVLNLNDGDRYFDQIGAPRQCFDGTTRPCHDNPDRWCPDAITIQRITSIYNHSGTGGNRPTKDISDICKNRVECQTPICQDLMTGPGGGNLWCDATWYCGLAPSAPREEQPSVSGDRPLRLSCLARNPVIPPYP